MKIFKFGGASVKDSQAIKNVGNIIKRFPHEKILMVVSAMGKTTNALEEVVALSNNNQAYTIVLNNIENYHSEIAQNLFKPDHKIFSTIKKWKEEIIEQLKKPTGPVERYDQVVSMGEIISSHIIYEALINDGFKLQWIDARDYIITNNTPREALVDWDETGKRVKKLEPILNSFIIITQGFIGRGANNLTTTLGREGSDYSAAIFGASLKAESVTIWKDVPGVMNADPKKLKAAITFEELPFQEAAEMSYYGASVIHPKTIKPLANAQIPLHVKSFYQPDQPGTLIHDCRVNALPPLIVIKENQCLISCKVTDFTFVDESQLSSIFKALSDHHIKINVMQNSAITFSFCVDFQEDKVLKLIAQLSPDYEIYYNTNLTLITVKNYDQATYDQYRNRPGVILEQSSRSTLQVLLK